MNNPSNVIAALQDLQKTFSTAIDEKKVFCMKIQSFRNAIVVFQKLIGLPRINIQKYEEEILKLCDTMLYLMTIMELPIECQLLCSKAACTGYSVLYAPKIAIKKCIEILNIKKVVSDSTNEMCDNHNVTSQTNDVFETCLCLAVLEMNSKIWSSCDNDYMCNILLTVIYPLCENAVYKYSCMTLTAFRCLVRVFDLLYNFNESAYVIPDKYFISTMNIIMSNWESPLTGVREQNCLLFHNFLLLTNKRQWLDCVCIDSVDLSSELYNENPFLYLVFTQQSWMTKSKYFLLSAIFKTSNNTPDLLKIYQNELLIGLKISLKFTFLAAAGSELYRVCTSKISCDDWKEIFLPTAVEILQGDGDSLAKQNLISYWIPTILSNNREIFNVLCDAVINLPLADNLTGSILLFKIGCNEGLINWAKIRDYRLKNKLEYNKLKIGLNHYDEVIRCDAFHSLCTMKITFNCLSIEEINLIKKFLVENVNYDSSRLRQNIINSCALLFGQFRDLFSLKLKNNSMDFCNLYDEDMKIIADFIVWFYKFLIGNLEDGCNYQRKYTSLVLYETLLNYFGKIDGTLIQRKSNNKHFGVKIKEFFVKLNKWNFTSDESKRKLFSCILDPSEPVRNMAANLLSNYFYFTDNDSMENNVDKLFKKGIDLCSDKFFYDVESGALLIETVTILVYKGNEKNSDSVKTSNNEVLKKFLNGKPNVLSILLDIAENQKCELFKDILKASTNGSPLHGILTAIKELLADRKSPEFGVLMIQDTENLLLLIESVVQKLVNALSTNSNITEFAPSFADMGLAIETIVQQSTLYNEFNDEDVQLSSAHQLILNCIWLNIKICCSLADKLITSSLLDSNVKNIERCVELIGFVLRKCRHKGAIETAGVSMMNATKYLTSHKNIEFQKIPGKILNEIFQTLMSSDKGTISRRSAGLSILVHRIIVGDCSPKKVLLHTCMVKLIEIAGKEVDANFNGLADSPQSRAFHFICGLVQDSTLRQEVAHHIHDVATLCFNNLSSNIWTIRNAALQLFGALLPKLVGQKKHQESEDECENYIIPFEELYFHMEDLFELIEKQLLAVVFTNDIALHSQVISSLTLLSNLTVTVYSCINLNLKIIIDKFNSYLEELFSSSIYHVRKLSAKIICNFCLPFELNNLILKRINQVMLEFKSKDSNKNKLHGLLMNLKFLLVKFDKLRKSYSNDKNNILYSLKEFDRIIISTDIPDFIKSIVSDILIYDTRMNFKDYSTFFVDNIKQDLGLKSKEKITAASTIGFPVWCCNEIKLVFLNCNLDELLKYVEIFLNDTIGDINISCLKSLKLRIINVKDLNFLNNCINILINFVILRQEIEIIIVAFATLLSVINQIKILRFQINYTDINNVGLVFDKYLNKFSKYGIKCSSLALPVVCSFISKEFSYDFIKSIVSLISAWSLPEEHDQDLRLLAVESLYQMIQFLRSSLSRCDEIGSSVWKSICNFLQDEDVNIRIEVTKFITEFYSDLHSFELKYINPYTALCLMYRSHFMEKLMSRKQVVKCLCDVLNEIDVLLVNDHSDNKFNPFDHGLSNVYKEDIKLVDLAGNELRNLVNHDEYKLHLYDIFIKNKSEISYHNVSDKEIFLLQKKLLLRNEISSLLHIDNET